MTQEKDDILENTKIQKYYKLIITGVWGTKLCVLCTLSNN